MKPNLGTLFIALCIASTARAGAVLQVDIYTPPDTPGMMYSPGRIVDFGVSIYSDPPQQIELRLLTLDFQASSPELTFVGPDNFAIGLPGSDGIPEFVFDYSTITFDPVYAKFPNYPQPNITYTLLGPIPGFMLVIPESGSLFLGTGQVQLPSSVTTPTYITLDALNADSNGPHNSTRLDFGFVDRTTWFANEGDITGNSPGMLIAPTPSALALIASGAVLALRRRRTGPVPQET